MTIEMYHWTNYFNSQSHLLSFPVLAPSDKEVDVFGVDFAWSLSWARGSFLYRRKKEEKMEGGEGRKEERELGIHAGKRVVREHLSLFPSENDDFSLIF